MSNDNILLAIIVVIFVALCAITGWIVNTQFMLQRCCIGF